MSEKREKHRMNRTQAEALGIARQRPHKKRGNIHKGEDALTEVRKVYLKILKQPGITVRQLRLGSVILGGQKYWKSRWPAIRDYLLSEELVFTRAKSKRKHLYYPTDPTYLWPVAPPVESDDVECGHDEDIAHPTEWTDEQRYVAQDWGTRSDEEPLDGPIEEVEDDVATTTRISMAGQYTDCIEVLIHDSNGNVVQEGTFGNFADIAIENIKGATVRTTITRTAGGQCVTRLEVHLS